MLSLSHCAAKAVRVPPGALHLCYCFTPMRYVWDLEADYARGAGRLTRLALPAVAAALRRWDRRTRGVDAFVAISHHIADRIRRVYGRDADVIHPPVDVARFRPADTLDDYYLVVSALVPYKRVDLAVAAAGRLGRRLLIVGSGPEEARLRAMAGPSVTFLGWRPDAEVAELYARCRAVLFPAVEDYGIVPLEAAAAGRPTLALARRARGSKRWAAVSKLRMAPVRDSTVGSAKNTAVAGSRPSSRPTIVSRAPPRARARVGRPAAAASSGTIP